MQINKEKVESASKKSHDTTVQILMFYFFLFYRLSQSTKLHPRVLITSIAKTQRGKFSREFNLYYARPLLGMSFLLCFSLSLHYHYIPTRFTLLSFSLFFILSLVCTMVAPSSLLLSRLFANSLVHADALTYASYLH